MGSQDFADATDQVAVGGELPAGKEGFEFTDDLVEASDEGGY